MAKVRAVYRFTRQFDESMVPAVQRVYRTKGIKGIDAMAMKTVNVDYDDSLLTITDVDRIMSSAGLPVSRTSSESSTAMQGTGPKPTETKKAGCFIVTAACGDAFAPEVIELSVFRDNFLYGKRIGHGFIWLYYLISPPVADVIARSKVLRRGAMALVVRPAVLLVQKIQP